MLPSPRFSHLNCGNVRDASGMRQPRGRLCVCVSRESQRREEKQVLCQRSGSPTVQFSSPDGSEASCPALSTPFNTVAVPCETPSVNRVLCALSQFTSPTSSHRPSVISTSFSMSKEKENLGRRQCCFSDVFCCFDSRQDWKNLHWSHSGETSGKTGTGEEATLPSSLPQLIANYQFPTKL